MASQITGVSIVYSTLVRAQIKENIRAPRRWTLLREFTDTSVDSPNKRVSKAEIASISWRHHVDIVIWIKPQLRVVEHSLEITLMLNFTYLSQGSENYLHAADSFATLLGLRQQV